MKIACLNGQSTEIELIQYPVEHCTYNPSAQSTAMLWHSTS